MKYAIVAIVLLAFSLPVEAQEKPPSPLGGTYIGGTPIGSPLPATPPLGGTDIR